MENSLPLRTCTSSVTCIMCWSCNMIVPYCAKTVQYDFALCSFGIHHILRVMSPLCMYAYRNHRSKDPHIIKLSTKWRQYSGRFHHMKGSRKPDISLSHSECNFDECDGSQKTIPEIKPQHSSAIKFWATSAISDIFFWKKDASTHMYQNKPLNYPQRHLPQFPRT